MQQQQLMFRCKFKRWVVSDWILGPREQVNQLTSWIDASMVYGNSQKDALELRELTPGESTIIQLL